MFSVNFTRNPAFFRNLFSPCGLAIGLIRVYICVHIDERETYYRETFA